MLDSSDFRMPLGVTCYVLYLLRVCVVSFVDRQQQYESGS
jgi:hypothetical protein